MNERIGRTSTVERHPDAVSWYRRHLEASLSLIERSALGRNASIIDGGGESTLVDDLLARGFQNVTVLDISRGRMRYGTTVRFFTF